MNKTIRNSYQVLVKSGKLNPDQAQIDILDDLEGLEKRILEPASSSNLLGRLFGKKQTATKGIVFMG